MPTTTRNPFYNYQLQQNQLLAYYNHQMNQLALMMAANQPPGNQSSNIQFSTNQNPSTVAPFIDPTAWPFCLPPVQVPNQLPAHINVHNLPPEFHLLTSPTCLPREDDEEVPQLMTESPLSVSASTSNSDVSLDRFGITLNLSGNDSSPDDPTFSR